MTSSFKDVLINSMKLIMEFDIVIDRSAITTLESDTNIVKIIPFTGSVDSDLFKGTVVPGAADVQVTNSAGIRHMCAKYMFVGYDANHNPCKLFVENNGYFEPGSSPKPFVAYPTFITDSPLLQPYLSKQIFKSEGHSHDQGVTIKIFDMSSH